MDILLKIDWALLASAVITIFGLASLTHYRIKKKFKTEPIKNKWDFFDRNIVEIIHGLVLVPDWALIVKIFS